MTNIIPLKPSNPPIVQPGQPNELLVERLEELLAFAKSGELRAMATAMTLSDDRVQTGWTTAAGEHDRLASGILTLMHRFGAATVGDD